MDEQEEPGDFHDALLLRARGRGSDESAVRFAGSTFASKPASPIGAALYLAVIA